MMEVEFRILSFLYIIWLSVNVFAKLEYNTVTEEVFKTTEFEPQVSQKTCLLVPDPGPCRANISMYYFKPSEQNCSEFRWGGCQGNGNRFDSKTECLNQCLTKAEEPKRRPTFCKLTFDYGFCFGDIKRWYYDPYWKTCKETIYSGCGGNKNNFYNEEQCDSVCRYGIGRVAEVTKDGKKIMKVLIVNPDGATSKRGKNQTTTKTKKGTTYINIKTNVTKRTTKRWY